MEKPIETIIQEFLVANYAAAPELAEGQFGYDETFSFAVADAAVHGLDVVGAPSFEDNRVSVNGADYVTVVQKQHWKPLNPCMLEPVTLLSDEAGEIVWNVNDGILPPAVFVPEGSVVDEAAGVVRTPLVAAEAGGFQLALGPFVRSGLRVDRLNYRVRTAAGESPLRVVSIFSLDAYAKKNALRRGSFVFSFAGDKPGLIGTKKRFALWTIAKGADGTFRRSRGRGREESRRGDRDLARRSGEPHLRRHGNLRQEARLHVLLPPRRRWSRDGRGRPPSRGHPRPGPLPCRGPGGRGSRESAGSRLRRLLPRPARCGDLGRDRARRSHRRRSFLRFVHRLGHEPERRARCRLRDPSRSPAPGPRPGRHDPRCPRDGPRRPERDRSSGPADGDTAHSNLGYLTFKTCEAAHGLTHLKIDPMMLEGQILQTWKMLQIAKGWPNLPIPDGLAIADFDQDLVYGILKTWCADFDLDYPFAEGTAPMPTKRPVPYTDDLAKVKEVMRRLTLAETVIEHVYNSGLVMAEDFSLCFYDFARLVLSGYGAITDIAEHFAGVPIVGPVAAKVKAIIHGRLVRVVEKLVNLVASKLKAPYGSLAPTIASFAVYIYGKIMKLEIPGENSSWVKEMGSKLAGKYALTAIPKLGLRRPRPDRRGRRGEARADPHRRGQLRGCRRRRHGRWRRSLRQLRGRAGECPGGRGTSHLRPEPDHRRHRPQDLPCSSSTAPSSIPRTSPRWRASWPPWPPPASSPTRAT